MSVDFQCVRHQVRNCPACARDKGGKGGDEAPRPSDFRARARSRSDAPFRTSGELVLTAGGLVVASCGVGVVGSLARRTLGPMAQQVCDGLNMLHAVKAGTAGIGAAAPLEDSFLVDDEGHFTAGECELPGYPDGSDDARGAAVFAGDGQPFCFISPDTVVGGTVEASVKVAEAIAGRLNAPTRLAPNVSWGLFIDSVAKLQAEQHEREIAQAANVTFLAEAKALRASLLAADREISRLANWLHFESGIWLGDMSEMSPTEIVTAAITFGNDRLGVAKELGRRNDLQASTIRQYQAEDEARKAEVRPAPGRDPATVDECAAIVRQVLGSASSWDSANQVGSQILDRLKEHLGEFGLPEPEAPGSAQVAEPVRLSLSDGSGRTAEVTVTPEFAERLGFGAAILRYAWDSEPPPMPKMNTARERRAHDVTVGLPKRFVRRACAEGLECAGEPDAYEVTGSCIFQGGRHIACAESIVEATMIADALNAVLNMTCPYCYDLGSHAPDCPAGILADVVQPVILAPSPEQWAEVRAAAVDAITREVRARIADQARRRL